MSVLRNSAVSYAIPLVFEVFTSLKRIESFLLLSNMPQLEPLEYSPASFSQEHDHALNDYAQVLVREPHLTKQKPAINQDVMTMTKSDVNLSVTDLTCKLIKPAAAPYTTSKEKIPRERDDNIDHSCSKPVIGSYDENLEISEEEKATGKISFALYWDVLALGFF
ncbi:hypothetical protein OS493_005682 [Desmophyllum pertusum]|uniref:Uncharacterized protein n=1 Tax=Desmophyllum pertusum TaxID=174260 RepID=A0A9W9YSS4_9CNID|nr:hypothetical protein OS493_005682 [Desmophyllum pertusum]